MSVKRYVAHTNIDDFKSDWHESKDGPMVRHDDYAALEARCAALAAENAGLKAAHPQPFGPVMMKALDAYEKHQDETPETGMLDAFFILRDSIRVDTTATDAFLDEVRASGVCLVIDYHNERADALRDIDRNGAFRHESAALDAIDVMMKIRKGVQS